MRILILGGNGFIGKNLGAYLGALGYEAVSYTHLDVYKRQAQKYGIKVMVLTGRECKATERRMQELKVDFLFQNIKDKLGFLVKYAEENCIDFKQIAYIGDDLNDLPVMKIVGIVGCPSDACEEVKQIADYIGTPLGGNGAVRDVIMKMRCV